MIYIDLNIAIVVFSCLVGGAIGIFVALIGSR